MGRVSEQTILVVDDEEAIAEAVRARLEAEGYRVVAAADGPEAIAAHAEHHPDLVVLDLMLPGMDGLEVCKQIQRDGWTPVLMLTARAEEADKVAGFAVGADDYLTKPFSLRELTVRVKAILRRVDRIKGAVEPAGPVERNGMMIDAARRRVEVDGEEVGLTPLEFEILYTLARDPGVDHHPVALDRSAGLDRALDAVHAAQDRFHPDGQLAQAERLREVVVGADGEPGHLVGLLGPGGQHQDGRPAVALDLLADLEPVHPRQHQVQDDQIGMVLGVRRDRLGAVGGGDDAVSLGLEPGPHRFRDRLLVVDDEDRLLAHAPHRTRDGLRANGGSMEKL